MLDRLIAVADLVNHLVKLIFLLLFLAVIGFIAYAMLPSDQPPPLAANEAEPAPGLRFTAETAPPLPDHLKTMLKKSDLRVLDDSRPRSINYTLILPADVIMALTEPDIDVILRRAYELVGGQAQTVGIHLFADGLDAVFGHLAGCEGRVQGVMAGDIAYNLCALRVAQQHRPETIKKIRWLCDKANRMAEAYFNRRPIPDIRRAHTKIDKEWNAFLNKLSGGQPCFSAFFYPEAEAKHAARSVMSMLSFQLGDERLSPQEEELLMDSLTRMNAVEF